MPIVIRPEERPKLIGLIAAIGALVIYFMVSILPRLFGGANKSTDVAQAPPVAVSVTPAGAQGATPALVAPGQPAAPDLYADTTSIAVPRDPFAPVSPGPNLAALPTNPPASAHPASGLAGPQFAQRGVHTANQAGSPNGVATYPIPSPAGQGPVVPVAPPPIVVLKGVIIGDPLIAVLEIAGQTYYKFQGDKLANGLVLEKIAESGIVLKYGKTRITVEVGQSSQPGNNAPGAVAAPETTPGGEKPICEVVPAASAQTAPPSTTPLRVPFDAMPVVRTNPVPAASEAVPVVPTRPVAPALDPTPVVSTQHSVAAATPVTPSKPGVAVSRAVPVVSANPIAVAVLAHPRTTRQRFVRYYRRHLRVATRRRYVVHYKGMVAGPIW